MKILAIAEVAAEEPFNIDIPAMGIELVVTLGNVSREFLELVLFKKGGIPYCGVNGDFDDRTVPDYADIHGKVKRVGNIRVAGFEGSPKSPSRKRRHTHPEWKARWKLRSLPRVDLFLSHCPPPGIHERSDGFQAVRDYLEKKPPRYFLHTHVGENAETAFGETTVISITGKRILELGF